MLCETESSLPLVLTANNSASSTSISLNFINPSFNSFHLGEGGRMEVPLRISDKFLMISWREVSLELVNFADHTSSFTSMSFDLKELFMISRLSHKLLAALRWAWIPFPSAYSISHCIPSRSHLIHSSSLATPHQAWAVDTISLIVLHGLNYP